MISESDALFSMVQVAQIIKAYETLVEAIEQVQADGGHAIYRSPEVLKARANVDIVIGKNMVHSLAPGNEDD